MIEKIKHIARTIIGGIGLPYGGSFKLQENLGFKKVAHFKNIGYKFNQWIDVGYWEIEMPEK